MISTALALIIPGRGKTPRVQDEIPGEPGTAFQQAESMDTDVPSVAPQTDVKEEAEMAEISTQLIDEAGPSPSPSRYRSRTEILPITSVENTPDVSEPSTTD